LPCEKDKQAEFITAQTVHFNNVLQPATCNPDMLAIITDALAPSNNNLQVVSAWQVWWNGHFHNNWCTTGFSTSDDAELLAIAAAFDNIPHPLDRIHAIHILSDSTKGIWNSLDASHHSGQLSSLCICNVILPWLTLHDTNHVFFHHTTNGVETGDHSLVHLLCTGTCVQAGNSLIISADYAQQVAVDCMLSEWHIMSYRKL
jgi:hypothetical protein